MEEKKQNRKQLSKKSKVAIGVSAVLAIGAAVAIPTGIVVTNNTQYEVTIDVGGGKEVQKVKKGTMLSFLTKPTKTGYIFVGWYTSANFEEETRLDDNTLITKNMTLYALMVKSQISISYSIDGQISSIYIDPDATVAELTEEVSPSKVNCNFIGWSTNNSIEYILENSTKLQASQTYYAMFEKITYAPKFVSRDGSVYAENLTLTEDNTYIIPTHTIETEYIDEASGKTLYFQGWVKENEYNQANPTLYLPYKELEKDELTDDFPFKAYYAEEKQTLDVSLNEDGETYTLYSWSGSLSEEISELPTLYKGKIITILSTTSDVDVSLYGAFNTLIIPNCYKSVSHGSRYYQYNNVDTLVIGKNVNYISLMINVNNIIDTRKYDDKTDLSAGLGYNYYKPSNKNNGLIKYTKNINGTQTNYVFDGWFFYKETNDNKLIAIEAVRNYSGIKCILNENTTKLSKDMFKSFNAYTGFTITVPDSITTLEFEEGFVIPSDVTFNSTHIDFSPYYAS